MKIYEVLVFDDLITSDGLNPAKFSEFLNHVLVFSKKHPRAGDRNYSSNSLHDITNQRRHTAEDSWGMRAILFFTDCIHTHIIFTYTYPLIWQIHGKSQPFVGISYSKRWDFQVLVPLDLPGFFFRGEKLRRCFGSQADEGQFWRRQTIFEVMV